MSVEKERDLFELWCIKDDEFCIHRYAGSDDYSDDYTQCAWMAWQASANRQWYKIVPIDTLNECLNWSSVAAWDSPSKEMDIEIAYHVEIIKDIIGEETK